MGRFVKRKIEVIKPASHCKLQGCQNCFPQLKHDKQNRRYHCSIACKLLDSFELESFSSCWTWTGLICGEQAYICWGFEKYSARKLSYHLFVNPILKNSHVKYTCNNQLCINPKHLYSPMGKLSATDAKEIIDLVKYLPLRKVSELYNVPRESMKQLDAARLNRLINIKEFGYF